MAIKNHKPTVSGYWDNILLKPESLADLPTKLLELNNFKKIALIEAIRVRLSGCKINTFGIRNGKVWLDQEPRKEISSDYLKLLDSVIYQSLVESIKSKATTVQLPIGMNLTLPKSEKSFVGNLPLGTSIDLVSSDAIVGINWKGKDGAQDLDLKLIDIDGAQFGWNANFVNQFKTVVYSGDMTSANPEATELFYAAKGFKPSVVKVNLYNGKVDPKFRFFLSKEKYTKKTKHNSLPTIDPNNIIISVDVAMESREMTLGVITENKFHIAKLRTGNKQVAGNSITNKYIDYTLQTLDCYVDLNTLLIDAGFSFSDTIAELDLTNLSKDTLINLLTKLPETNDPTRIT